MRYYAWVVFETNASIAEGHEELTTARRWIEQERKARPALFRAGQILTGTPERELVATFDVEGWKPVAAEQPPPQRVKRAAA